MTEDDEEAAFAGVHESTQRRFDSNTRAAFEERAVVHVLKGCGMYPAVGMLRDRARELTGEPVISFAILHHFVADFPIRLGVAKLYHLRESLTLEALFRRPKLTQPYRAFHEWAEEDPADDDRPRGIIFAMPGCPGVGGRAILHTYPAPADAEKTRVTFGVRDRRGDVAY